MLTALWLRVAAATEESRAEAKANVSVHVQRSRAQAGSQGSVLNGTKMSVEGPEGTEQIETIRLLSEEPLAQNLPYLRAIWVSQGVSQGVSQQLVTIEHAKKKEQMTRQASQFDNAALRRRSSSSNKISLVSGITGNLKGQISIFNHLAAF